MLLPFQFNEPSGLSGHSHFLYGLSATTLLKKFTTEQKDIPAPSLPKIQQQTTWRQTPLTHKAALRETPDTSPT